MAAEIQDARMMIKRSSVGGTQPSLPTDNPAAVSIYDPTLGGWRDGSDGYVDLLDAEWFANTADDKIWVRMGSQIRLIWYSGQTTEFIDLGDTPSAYTGFQGYSLVVAPGEQGLTFQEIIPVNNFLDLNDSPTSYVGAGGSVVTVLPSETGMTFTTLNTSLSGLTDFPAYSAGTTADVLILNSTADGLDWSSIALSPTLQDVSDNGTTTTNVIGYKANYHSLYNDRSFVDREYVDGIATGGGTLRSILANGDTTFGNDINISDTDGINFQSTDGAPYGGKLNGASGLTGDLTYTLPSTGGTLALLSDISQDLQSVLDNGSTASLSDVGNFSISNGSTTTYNSGGLVIASENSQIYSYNGGNDDSFGLITTPTYCEFRYSGGEGGHSLKFTSNTAIFKDNRYAPVGLIYENNYGPGGTNSFTDRSLVDKGYVDSAIAASGGTGYLVYTALLSQAGSSNPTISVLDNSLNFTLSFNEWQENGVYNFNIPAEWDLSKVSITLSHNTSGSYPSATVDLNMGSFASSRLIYIETTNNSNTYSANILKYAVLEIRLYN